MIEIALPQLGTIVFAAALDSINPCAIGVLILLISTLFAGNKTRGRMLLVGTAYIFAVFATYLLAGIGLLFFFATLPILIAQYITIAVSTLVIGMGIVEIKDYFWYGRGFSLAISKERAKQIHEKLKNISVPGVIALGAFVAAVELPCTGGPYLAVIMSLSQSFSVATFLLIVLYNLIFIAPLVAILFLVYAGIRLSKVKRWKHSNRKYMRLLIGLTLIYLGWLLVFIANGTINFG